MKVAVVYTGRKGGGNLYTLLIARAVRDSGFDTKVFLSNTMDNLHEFQEDGFEVESFDTFKGGIVDALMFPIRAWKMASAINKYAPDVIYTTMFNPYITAIEFLCRGKKIYTFHNYTAVKKPMDHVIDFVQDISMRLASHVIVLSNYFDGIVQRKFPGKKTYIIPLPTFRYQGNVEKLKYGKEFGRYLLFTGRMTEKYKGLEVIEDAFGMIESKDEKLKLVIAGRGATPKLTDSKRIIKIGKWLSDEEFNGLVRNSFLVIVPYLQPNPSAVAAAATALGTPTVASDFPCLNEQVINGRNGALFKPGNAEDLAETILRINGNIAEYAKLKTGTIIVAKQLDIESLQPKIKKMLEEIGEQ